MNEHKAARHLIVDVSVLRHTGVGAGFLSRSRRHVRRGGEFLCAVSRQNIKRAFKHERSGKSRERPKAALLRKERHGMEDIAVQWGLSAATVFEWPYRLDQEESGLPRARTITRDGRKRIGTLTISLQIIF